MHGTPPHTVWAVAALLLNALVWGLSWWPFKQLALHGLHPLWTTAIVYGLSFAAMAVWGKLVQTPRGAWRAHPGLWCLLIASGMTNVGFNWAVTMGDVVRVVLLFYLMPAWSVLVAWWLLGDKPHAGALLRLLLALSGLAIVLHQPDSPWPVPESLADALALLGGLSFAVTNALLLKLKNAPETARMQAMFGGGASMAMLTALALSTQSMVTPSLHWMSIWNLPVLLLTLGFLLGNLALQYGTARLPAHTTALVMLSEVVFASVSSVLLGASTWDHRTLLGGALILLAAVLSIWMPNHNAKE